MRSMVMHVKDGCSCDSGDVVEEFWCVVLRASSPRDGFLDVTVTCAFLMVLTGKHMQGRT